MNRVRGPAELLPGGDRLASGPAAAATPTAGLHRDDARHAAALPWLVTLGLFALAVALQYPGTMGNDATNQYAEAVSGRYTDWHPAVMAWLWSLLRVVADGPAPMWLLQVALYWIGIGLLADAMQRRGRRRIALAIALAGAFPLFFHHNGMITKDAGMVAAWVAAAGLMFWFRAQERRVPLLWSVVVAALIVYGTLVRSNAVFALGPLLLYALAPAAWLRTMRLLAATVVIAVFAIPLTQQANQLLFQPLSRDPVHSLLLFDLMGMAAHEQQPALAEPRATLSRDELRACYTPYWWDSFSPWGRCGDRVHRPDDDHATRGDGLAAQWALTIVQHPMAYAVHRLKHFNSSLMFAVPLKHQRLAPDYRNDDPAFKPIEVFSDSSIRFDVLRRNALFWPVTWLAWGAALLVLLARERAEPPLLLARSLLVSALAYSGAYLVIGVATDLRYHYWSMLAVIIATLVTLPLLGERWRRRSPALLGALTAVGAVVAVGMAARLLDFQAWVV